MMIVEGFIYKGLTNGMLPKMFYWWEKELSAFQIVRGSQGNMKNRIGVTGTAASKKVEASVIAYVWKYMNPKATLWTLM